MKSKLILTALAGTYIAIPAQGALTNYTDYTAWAAVVGSHTTISFQGFTAGTAITNQYLGSGATFAGAEAFDSSSFAKDGEGVARLIQWSPITMYLTDIQNSVGTHYPGAIRFRLFMDGALVGTSESFGESGGPYFAGIVSDASFNRVEFDDWYEGRVFMDDIYFGTASVPAVPEPFTMGLAALGLGVALKRRRR